MAEFKGTPGKWDITVDELSNSISVDDGRGTGEICDINTDDNHLTECIFNAQLISKAPEMFAMLQSVLDLQKRYYGNGSATHVSLITKASEIEILLNEATQV